MSVLATSAAAVAIVPSPPATRIRLRSLLDRLLTRCSISLGLDRLEVEPRFLERFARCVGVAALAR